MTNKELLTQVSEGITAQTLIDLAPDSIELSRNYKGETSWKIKKYGSSLDEIIQAVKAADDEMTRLYGPAKPGVSVEVE